jgi:large subunit ribosomal protein L25
MSDALTIQAEPRDPAKNKGTGSRVARRLRAQGRIPAIVYGHKQPPQPISLARGDAWLMIKKSAHLAQLTIGDKTEMALVKDIQWDHLGKEIIHLDFARVDAQEQVHTEVRLETHGTAPGVGEGGVLEFLVHTLPVVCRADAIPDVVRIELGGLHVNDGVHVRDLTLPEGVTIDVDPNLLLLHIVGRPVTGVEAEAEAEVQEVEGEAEAKEGEA